MLWNAVKFRPDGAPWDGGTPRPSLLRWIMFRSMDSECERRDTTSCSIPIYTFAHDRVEQMK
ncbi:hypothetical protein BRADI_1g56531v3 [Brachypodium distachyon]|uniref:Uncharacterized protein n=1 Tax=Brachypodium distachyon TaxID=15368 RepID=A0A0Q3HDY6_BRADI|nr:hypothetical protein BRADI_1g56531v3 [Brachypodium distachyon]